MTEKPMRATKVRTTNMAHTSTTIVKMLRSQKTKSQNMKRQSLSRVTRLVTPCMETVKRIFPSLIVNFFDSG